METTKPIKRHATIVEFSKDHHFALLLVWKIREGLKKSIEPSRITKYAINFFDNDLIPHFKGEEEFLFSKLSKENKLRIRAESEHENIYMMMDGLRKNPDDKDLLQKFADTLEKHIRFEERELYNYLQSTISESDLLKIASSLKSREHEPDTLWTDAFWENRTPKV
jgi:hemerythrin-like domain-containing protein